MTTFYDEIVAGIVTLFKFCMHRDIYEKQTDFQYIYDFSKCCQGNSFYKVYLIQTRLHKSRSSRSELEFDLSNFV